MLTMAEKSFLGLAIILSIGLVGVVVLPATSSYEVSLVTSPNGETLFIPAGKPFNITCKGLGDEAGKFSSLKWLNKEGKVIPEGIPGTKEEAKNSLTLKFTNPEEDESGVYKCVAAYEKKNMLQKSVSIIFHGNKPLFKKTYENVTATESSYLEMVCTAEGELPITYEWYNQDEEKITGNSSSSIHVYNTENNTSVLIIPTVSMNHEEDYTCLAKNRHGLSSKIFFLTVLAKDNDTTKASFGNAEVINVSATSVKFALNVTGPVKSIQVKYYEIRNKTESFKEFEYYEIRNKTESVKEFKYGDIYEIKDLIPAGQYNFEFRTYPSASDKWSRPYRVILLPDKPEVIFRSIGSGTIRFEWNFKFEDRMRKTIDRHEITYFTVQMVGGGESWKPNTCAITIQIPECTSSSYTISGLSQNVYYEIQLRAHTASGYGEPYTQKIFMPDRY